MSMNISDTKGIAPQSNISESKTASRVAQIKLALASLPEKIEGRLFGSKVSFALPVNSAQAEKAVNRTVTRGNTGIGKKDFFQHQFSIGGSLLKGVLTSLGIGTTKVTHAQTEIRAKISTLEKAMGDFATAYLEGSDLETKLKLREKLDNAFDDVAKLKSGNKEGQKEIHQLIGKAHIFLVNSQHLNTADQDVDTDQQKHSEFRIEQSARRWYAAVHPDKVNPDKMLATANLQTNGLQSIMRDHLEKNVDKTFSKGESSEIDKAFRELSQLHKNFKMADSKNFASFTKLETSFNKFAQLYQNYNIHAHQNPIDKDVLQSDMKAIQDLRAELQDIMQSLRNDNPKINLNLKSAKSDNKNLALGDPQTTLLLAGVRTLNGYLETLSGLETALHYQINPQELYTKNQSAIKGTIPPFLGGTPKGVTVNKSVTVEQSQDNYLLFKAETDGKVYMQAHFRIDPEDGRIHGYKGLRDPDKPSEEKVWNTFEDFRKDLGY